MLERPRIKIKQICHVLNELGQTGELRSRSNNEAAELTSPDGIHGAPRTPTKAVATA